MATYASGFKLGLAATTMLLMAVGFQVSMKTTAGYMETMDPAYPFLQAVAMHEVNGEPFLHYLSLAIRENSEVVEGVNVTEELARFQEEFHLYNSTERSQELAATRRPELAMDEVTIREAHLAVPPGGVLVMIYEWS